MSAPSVGVPLTLVDLDKRFGSTIALSGVSVALAAGRVLALLGPARSGKSTVLRIIAGLESADRGRVLIDGRDVTDAPPRARHVGLVSGPQAAFGNLTVRANIEFGLRSRGRIPAEQRDRAERALVDTGLAAHAGKHPHQLTASQRIRVVLARALAASPQILLVEDPVGVDGPAYERLRDLIGDLQREWSVTTVWATRDPRTAFATAHDVLLLRDGRPLQGGPAAQVHDAPADAAIAELLDTVSWVPAVATEDGSWRVLDRCVGADRQGRPGLVASAAVRPTQVVVVRGGSARVRRVTFQGGLTRLVVEDPIAGPVVVDLLSRDAVGLHPGTAVRLGLHQSVGHVLLRRPATDPGLR